MAWFGLHYFGLPLFQTQRQCQIFASLISYPNMASEAIDKTKAALEAAGITKFTVNEHPVVHTAEELIGHAQPSWGKLCKNLFVKDKKGNRFLMVIAADRKVNMKNVGKLLVSFGFKFLFNSFMLYITCIL